MDITHLKGRERKKKTNHSGQNILNISTGHCLKNIMNFDRKFGYVVYFQL